MTIVRYDPFRDLRTLQEEVNRLFSTNLTRGFRRGRHWPRRLEPQRRYL